MARMLERFEERTGVPVVVNTSLNTAGRPMVDDPRDALECFGSAPVDLLAIGPFVVRRPGARRGRARRGGRRERASRHRRPDGRAGRRCALLDALAPRGRAGRDHRRRRPRQPARARCRTRSRRSVVRGAGRGPAAARNVGWRAGTRRWIAFLDDDVRARRRAGAPRSRADLRGRAADVGASQGRIARPAARRPAPDRLGAQRRRPRATRAGPPPTWPTAAPRSRAVGGFDERFPRAYREDADLGLRRHRRRAGGSCAASACACTRSARATAGSALRKQAGNADDVLMAALHGRDWRERAGAPRGRAAARTVADAPRRAGARAARGVAGGSAARSPPARGLGGGHRRVRVARASRPARATPREVATMLVDQRGDPVRAPPALVAAPALRDPRRAPAAAAAAAPRPSLLRPRRHARRRRALQRRPGAGRADAGRARGARPAARARACRLAVVSNQSGHRAGLLDPASRSSAVNAPGRGAARPVRHAGSSARTGPATAAAAASPRPGLIRGRRSGSASTRPLRGGRRHRRRRRGRARRRRARRPRPDRRARWREEVAAAPEVARDLARAVDAAARGAGMTPRASPCGSTTTATCCSPARRAGRRRAAPTASTLLCGPRGRGRRGAAAGRRRGRSCWRAPWIDPEPEPVDPRRRRARSSTRLARPRHRRARDLHARSTRARCRPRCCCGWPASPRIAAISDDYPGSLLDVRHRVPDDVHEVERGARRSSRRAGFDAAAAATTGGCACAPTAPRGARAGAVRRRASRRVGPGAGLGAGALRARWSARWPRPGAASSSPAAPASARSRAFVGRRRGGVDLGGAHDARRSWPACSPAPRGRRRQHRPGAPRRRGRHAGRLPVRPDRARGPLAARGGCRTCCWTSTCRAPAAARATARSPGHPCLARRRRRPTCVAAVGRLAPRVAEVAA